MPKISNQATGYSAILAAAVCWGVSAVWAKHLKDTGVAGTLLISQSRVFFGWLLLATFLALRTRSAFAVPLVDVGRFFLLGIFGVAGANFFLYYAIGPMDAAVADMIQFLAPVIVCLYMAATGCEPLDGRKVGALALAMCGCALALGVLHASWAAPLTAALSAALSAFCFAGVTIYGKTITARYPVATYLHYALLGATIFYFLVRPPWSLFADIMNSRPFTLLTFAAVSILLPYSLFFFGLSRVPASRASIVSTFEPVVVAIAGYLLLGDNLSLSQVMGICLVVAAIVVIETAPPIEPKPGEPVQPPQNSL